MRFLFTLALLSCLIPTTGCHSPYVQTTVSNQTGQTIELLEVDYPSASFGTQSLAPGAEFHYRFKVLGSGATTLLYTDSNHQEHKFNGPSLKEGAEGALTVIIGPSGVSWKTASSVSANH